MKKIIRIGSRDSVLALAQTRLVMDAIRQHHPDVELELVTMKTTGDRILDRTLDKVGGKGLFVKELDDALRSGQVDITVHSYKDMPMELDPQLPVVALSKREDPRDVLILPEGEADPEKPIGSASLRRQLQLEELFPGQTVAPVRGNVQTRLAKLDRGEYSALVLAAAGIRRLGLEQRISRVFTTDEILPAASQGIIAVQGRFGEDHSYLSGFSSEESCWISLAERSFVRTLDGGCSAPTAAYAQLLPDGNLLLRGLHHTPEAGLLRGSISGDHTKAQLLGRMLAEELLERAASQGK